MRGDSLRDFYAKALALLGLAVLAGVGALVDYWPTSINTEHLVTRGAPSAPALTPIALPDPIAFASSDATTIRGAGIARTPAVEPPTSATAAPALSITSIPIPSPVLPIAYAINVAPVDTRDLAATELVLAAPTQPPIFATFVTDDPEVSLAVEGPRTSAAPVGGEDSPVALVTDAFKKTGESLARTGALTGNSIVGAFRAVSGAFRKVPGSKRRRYAGTRVRTYDRSLVALTRIF